MYVKKEDRDNRSWVIYALHTKEAGSAYRYVGYSSVTMHQTFIDRHVNRANKGKNSLVYDWMRSVGVDNVTYTVIEQCPEGDIEFLWSREIHWIEYYQALQGDHINRATENYLKNNAKGGRGNLGARWTLSEEARRNQSLAQMGHVRSEESKRKQAETLTGCTLDEDHRKAISSAGVNAWQNAEERREAQVVRNNARWHLKGNHDVQPRFGCPLCPEYDEVTCNNLLKENCIRMLKEEPAATKTLHTNLSRLPMVLLTQALSELESEGKIAKVIVDRFPRWVILS